MSQDHNNPAFKKLLVKLQEESWQLELIISGFAIFGLITAYDPIKISVQEAQNNQQIYKFIIGLVAQISCGILIFNLLLHVLLRGLWIGALGLRYVSGDIDYDKLNYSPKFDKYLRKKVGSFDRYIATLENYCSIIFAVSFLLIFYVLAITFTIIANAVISTYIIANDALPSFIRYGLGIALILFLIFGLFFTLIDFITQGFLKRKKWTSKFYFPIYWVFSFITLSFLYRPLVYNFLDNKFGKRLSFILIPVYVSILILTSFKYQQSNYISPKNQSSKNYIDDRNYEDLLTEKEAFANVATLQSKVITDNYLKVFIVYTERIENRVFRFNESLKPEEDQRGLTSDIVIKSNGKEFFSRSKRDSLTTVYLNTFNEIYDIMIDSTVYESKFLISKNKKKQLGFETYIDIPNLKNGEHLLKIIRKKKEKEAIVKVTGYSIPFWYFKD